MAPALYASHFMDMWQLPLMSSLETMRAHEPSIDISPRFRRQLLTLESQIGLPASTTIRDMALWALVGRGHTKEEAQKALDEAVKKVEAGGDADPDLAWAEYHARYALEGSKGEGAGKATNKRPTVNPPA